MGMSIQFTQYFVKMKMKKNGKAQKYSMIVGFGELLFGVEASQNIDSKHYKRKKGLKI